MQWVPGEPICSPIYWGPVQKKNKGTTLYCLPKNRSAMRTCVAYQLPWSQRFFLSLRGYGSLISCREKSRKSSGTGVLTSRFFTYHWNPVDFPVCSFDYKKNWFTYTISTSLNVKENCSGSLTNCRGVTCDGLAPRLGGVTILLAASCYWNRDKLRLLWVSRLQSFTF